MSSTIALRQYQQCTVDDLVNTTDHVLVEQPTGAGKTIEIVAVVAQLLPCSPILIGTTQEHIERSFVERAYEDIVTARGIVRAPLDILQAVRDVKSMSMVTTLRSYVAQSGTQYALVTTHNALARVKPPTDLPSDLKGATLIIDEAHHSAALGLSQFVHAWRAAGGRVIFFTATGYRADEQPVMLPGMRRITRTLSQHMAEGFAPAALDYALTAVHVGERARTKEFFGETQPRARPQMVKKMIETWQADGQPKTIIRVPPSRGGSLGIAADVVRAFRKAGARVIDATGPSNETKRTLLQALAHDREIVRYDESDIDVIVGIQRVAEGLDWKWCSHIYCLGLPAAVVTAVQLVGRALRPKPSSYPEAYRDKCCVRFFVPCGDSHTLDQLPENHARRALLMCAFLADSQAGSDWVIAQDIARGRAISAGEGSMPTASQEVTAVYPYIDPKLRAEGRLAIATAVSDMHAEQLPVTVGSIYERLTHDGKANDAIIRQLLVEHLMAKNSETAAVAMSRLNEQIDANMRAGMDVKAAIEQSFDPVLREFIDATLVHSISQAKLVEHIHQLTAPTIDKFARMLEDNRQLIPDWVAGLLRAEIKAGRDIPTGASSGGPARYPMLTWAEIDDAIRNGKRGWVKNDYYPDLHTFALRVAAGRVKDYVNVFLDTVPRLTPEDRVFAEELIKVPIAFSDPGLPITPIGELMLSDGNVVGAARKWISFLKYSDDKIVACMASRFEEIFHTFLLSVIPFSSRDVRPDANDARTFFVNQSSHDKASITMKLNQQRVAFRVPPDKNVLAFDWSHSSVSGRSRVLEPGKYYTAWLMAGPTSNPKSGRPVYSLHEAETGGTGYTEQETLERRFGNGNVYNIDWPFIQAAVGMRGGQPYAFNTQDEIAAVQPDDYDGHHPFVWLPLTWVTAYLHKTNERGFSYSLQVELFDWARLRELIQMSCVLEWHADIDRNISYYESDRKHRWYSGSPRVWRKRLPDYIATLQGELAKRLTQMLSTPIECCPKCGRHPEVQRLHDDYVTMQCPRCGCGPNIPDDADTAIIRWNTYVSDEQRGR